MLQDVVGIAILLLLVVASIPYTCLAVSLLLDNYDNHAVLSGLGHGLLPPFIAYGFCLLACLTHAGAHEGW